MQLLPFRAIRFGMMVSIALFVTAIARPSVAAAEEFAPGSLDHAVDALAAKIAQYLKARDVDRCVVGNFEGPPPESRGQIIKKRLKEALPRHQVEVARSGEFGVRGSFRIKTDANDQLLVVLYAKMVDRSGTELYQLLSTPIKQLFNEPAAAVVRKKDDALALVSGNVDVSSVRPNPELSNPLAEESKKIVQSILSPSVHREGTELYPEKGSQFGLEILVKREGRLEPVPIDIDAGVPFVDLKAGEVYAVRIINRSTEFDIAVDLRIDGLNMFEFSEVPEFKALGRIVVGRARSGVIPGWYVNNQSAREFLVTDLANAPSDGIERETLDISTISLTIFPAWNINEPTPEVELNKIGESRGGPQKVTIPGQQIRQNLRTVEKKFGKAILATLKIHYDIPDELPTQ